MSQRGRTGRPSRYTDDTVRDCIHRVRAGESIVAVATALDINTDTVTAWCNGTNRGHILAQIERRAA